MFLRERLFSVLDDNRGAGCTWIAGPPGSGKTVLMASFVTHRSLPCVWYHIDADDGDPSAFFCYMAQAAHHALGEGADSLPRITPDAALSPLAFARLFFRELFAVVPELIVVLDDYQEAPVECPLHEILRTAIEQAADGVHLLVASRSHAPAVFARLQANGIVRLLAWEQLMLTAEEVSGIAGIHERQLDAFAAEEWRDRCGGWAAALRLLLRQAAPCAARLVREDCPELLFDYLGQEVFQDLEPALKSLLVRLAFLPRIPADAANDLAESPTAERQLAALAEENLFTTVSRDGPVTYRFHPLFRDFLLQRAGTDLPCGEQIERRHRAANELQSRGMIEDAAQVLLEAKSWDRLEGLVLGHAAGLMSQGRNTTLQQWLTRLPATRFEANPWLLYWRGVSQALHDPAAARGSLAKAYELLVLRHDRTGQLLAWSGVVDCIFHMYSDLAQLDAWIASLEQLLEVDPHFPSPEVEARVTFSMFVALSFRQPQHIQLPAWRQRLAAIADATTDPMFRLLSRLHLTVDQIWHGDLAGAGAELDKLVGESKRLSMSPLVKLIRHLSASSFALYAGDVEAGFEEVHAALAVSESSGINIWDKVLLAQGAALSLSRGDLQSARAFSRRMAAISDHEDNEEQALHHQVEAWCSCMSGKQAEAMAHVRLALQFSERAGLPHFHAVDRISAAFVCFECGEQAEAVKEVCKGRQLGASTRNPMIGWMADMLEAYMSLQSGEDAEMLVERCMSVGRSHGYRHFFFWPRKAVAVVCLRALEAEIHPDYVRDLVERAQLAPPPDASGSDRWPWPVKVFTLGTFSVVVHGVPISFEGKAQRAPLKLLKALIAFSGNQVPETKLIDALWPESDGDAGEQALATTLFRLRKLLGTSAIQRQNGHLSIEPSVCWVDCWALDKILGSPHPESRNFIEYARRLYAGPFLAGEDDAPWAMQLRERVHAAIVHKLCAAGADALAEGQIELASMVYDFGLLVDELVEEFYQGQIRCHIAQRQPSLAVTTYRRCQRTLSLRLGVAPSQSTTGLYLSAIRG